MTAKKKATKRAGVRRSASGEEPKGRLDEALKNFVRTTGAEYLKDRNITSVGVGYKVVDGTRSKDLAIQFTVERKASPEAVEAVSTTIPTSFVIEGVEVPTDVIQRDFHPDFRVVAEVPVNERKTRMDPVVPGISLANAKVTAGTVGCVVYDRQDGTAYVLSNWHVLNGPDGAIGDEIVQPGPFDDNRVGLNHLGHLVRSHLGHAGDCAISTVEGRALDPHILDLRVAVSELGEPELDDKVVKSGRTTGVTHGIVTRIHTITKLDYGGDFDEQQIGGFEIGPDPNHPPTNGEVSMGGDSGSVWVFKRNGRPTTTMAGLHFAGEGEGDPNEHALACYPKSVFEKLGIALVPPDAPDVPIRLGYSNDFLLGYAVPAPTLSSATRGDAVILDGSPILDYTHFSLTLSALRRFAIWVAWNIDGGRLMALSRKGLRFKLDPRLPLDCQVGEELYAGNDLDRGHVARRADVVWGGPLEADTANRDSFFFTNITPQMNRFNQSERGGLWGRLENAVFEDTDVDNLRVSVFGGPVLRDDDRLYRQVKIPREFWKVIAFVENDTLKAKGFMLTQSLDKLETLDLSEFKVYQVALTEIESRCGIHFAQPLRDADTVGQDLARQPEALQQRTPLASLTEIDWS